ncbi:MAG: hypothetical protein FJY10_11745 [Bacteroidetes bacterium]|nr:hypothetical protein [Bacteroidota bacterium]
MNSPFLNDIPLPFCKGCGHSLIAESVDRALSQLNLRPLDIILVTDIGCHGIIDQCFQTHTVHGLHGRSVALAAGISMGLNNPEKKVLAFLGDGGATIGMQHLIDAAHRNINMTVVLHNNMLYGMTGGQPSEFSPIGFKTPATPEGCKEKPYDICHVLTAAGANYVNRILGIGDVSGALAEAISRRGFSIVEIMELCPSYAMKSNPGMKLRQVIEQAGFPLKKYVDLDHPGYQHDIRGHLKPLMETEKVIPVDPCARLTDPVRIMLSGSAGEGVQLAAELFARAAIATGLNATKKGSYPVTVGIGFSSSDIIISPHKIFYTGSPSPDFLVITSADGLKHALPTISNMKSGKIFLESGLGTPDTAVEVVKYPFRESAGSKFSALFSLAFLIVQENFFPLTPLQEVIEQGKLAGKINWQELSRS